MSTTIHVHFNKAGLVLDVVKEWPASREWLTRPDGSKFASLQDAVQAVIDVPYPVVPMGCPTPSKDGTCPGHGGSDE